MDASATRPVIAIIDDDADVRETLSALMEASGSNRLRFRTATASRRPAAPGFDLALIDLRLKGESGLTLAIHIRETSELPIVMLTGVGDEIDKIIGLETGADDYLMKPFNPRELVARIRAVLRRYGHGVSAAKAGKDQEIIFGDKRVNLKRRELLDGNGDEIPLTNAEYVLLEYFVRTRTGSFPVRT